MKSTALTLASLLIFFSTTLPQISCAENTIEPYFPGLSEGIVVSETCSNYEGYSINLIEKEGDQQLDLYKNTGCTGPKNYSLVLGVEASLAGVWKNFLVFNEGTDVNGHNLRLVSAVKSEEVYTLAFEGDAPQFENKKIVYFAPSEEEATAKQCNALGIDFKDLKENSANVLIGHQVEFLLETKKSAPVKGQYTCYAVQ